MTLWFERSQYDEIERLAALAGISVADFIRYTFVKAAEAGERGVPLVGDDYDTIFARTMTPAERRAREAARTKKTG